MNKIIWGFLFILLGFFISIVIPGIGALPILGGLALIIWGIASVVISSGKSASITATGATYSFVNGNTAIAIYPDRKILLLKQGSMKKEYAFSDVRGWETNIQSGGQIYAGGSTALGMNIRTARENKNASGLFVTVRDINTPVYRINMLKKADQQRWMEILRQLINNE
jgi:hypothetical protein